MSGTWPENTQRQDLMTGASTCSPSMGPSFLPAWRLQLVHLLSESLGLYAKLPANRRETALPYVTLPENQVASLLLHSITLTKSQAHLDPKATEGDSTTSQGNGKVAEEHEEGACGLVAANFGKYNLLPPTMLNAEDKSNNMRTKMSKGICNIRC